MARRLSLLLLTSLLLLLAALIFLYPPPTIHAHIQTVARTALGSIPAPPPPRRSHIIVASSFGGHFDVYLAFVWTLQKLLRSSGSVRVYRPHPFNYGFTEVADRLGLYDGNYMSADNLIRDVNATGLYADDPRAIVDMLVLGTCEIDMRQWSDELLQVYDARPADKKFKLVCIVHNFKDAAWHDRITPWARRGAIRLLSISEHVAASFRTKFATLADSADPAIYGAGYEYIPVNFHIPVLALSEPPEKRPTAPLSNAVIQGSFEIGRRDYTGIFADLQQALAENPSAWGYKVPLNTSAPYEPDPTLAPFILHLAGHGNIDIPHNLTNLVRIHTGLQYPEFYALMKSMDIVLPAFSPYGGYFDSQASSTMAMAVECNVPILVTNHIRAAYTYIADDRIVVTRPQALREIHAIQTLRTGRASLPHNLTDDAARELEHAAERMLEQGWRRSNRGFAAVKAQIWRANQDVARLVLNDQAQYT